MKKFIKKYLSGVMVLFLSFCLVACGSTAGKKSVSTFKTQKLFSKYSKDKGIHMGISMKNNGTDISVDIYQLGEKMYLDATSGEDRFLYIVKDDILTVLDPVNKVYEQREITDDVEKQLKTVTSGIDNILEIGQMDIKYEKGTVKLDGMEYDTEEVVNGDSTIKFVYNDDGKLVYVIRMDGTTETDIKITAFDGDVKESQFDIPDGYTSTSEADTSISSTSTEKNNSSSDTSTEKNNSSSDTSTEKNNSISDNSTGITDKEVTNEEGGYSFKTADYNIISKNGEVTTVYTNSKEQVPYFNVVTLKKGSGDTVDENLDRLSEAVMDKYKNRIASLPVKVSAQLTGRTAYGIEYSYSTEDGKNTIKVSQYVDDLGDAWASWAAVYYPGDAVTLSELQEAMDSLTIQAK